MSSRTSSEMMFKDEPASSNTLFSSTSRTLEQFEKLYQGWDESSDVGDSPKEAFKLFYRFGRFHVTDRLCLGWVKVDALSMNCESQEFA